MASLTDQTNAINSGKRLVEPERTSGTSFLGGLSRLASQGIEGLDNASRQARQIAEDERQKQGRAVINQVESFVTTERANAAEAIRTPVADSPGLSEHMDDLMVPEEVKREAVNLDRQRRAVEQGRSTQEGFDLKLEKFVLEMNNKYPDFASDIGTYMRQNLKIDHVLWRDQALQDKLESAAEQGQISGTQDMVELAVKSGFGSMGLSSQQLYRAGVGVAEAQARAEAAEKAKNAALQASKEDRDVYDWNTKRSDEAIGAAASAEVNGQLGVLVDTIQNLAKSTDYNDAAYERVIGLADDVDMLFDREGAHIIQRLQAEGASKAVEDRVRAQIEDRRKAVKDIFFGSSSRFAQRNRAYQYMQQTLGMDAEKALPFYMFAKRIVGAAGVEGIFGGDIVSSLSPQLVNKLKSEIAGWDPTNRNEGMNILAEIGALSRGDVNLADIPEEKLTGDHMRGINATVKRASEQIMDPEPDDPGEYDTFLGGLGNLSIGALRFTQGNTDLKALNYTLGAVTNQRNMRVLETAIKNPQYRDRARTVLFATRQASAKVLEVARAVPDTGNTKVTLNRNGVFVAQRGPAGGIRGHADFNPPPIMDETGMSGAFEGMFGKDRVNAETKERVDIMNQAVAHLASTAALDPAFKGYSHQELVLHYSGAKRLQPKTEGEKPPADVQRSISEFEASLQSMSNRIEEDVPFASPTSGNRTLYEPMAHRAGQVFGVPASVMSFVLGQESGWNPNIGRTKIDNDGDGIPDSTAVGIAQFTIGTGKLFGLVGDGFDYRGVPEKAIPAAARYLGQLHKKLGSWEKALNAYGVIDRRNFKSDEEYQAVLRRARAAISSGD